MITFYLEQHPAAQDMIQIIVKEKNLSATEAINFAISKDSCNKILNTGWRDIAVDLWGHADPERKWSMLNNPVIQTELDEEKFSLLNHIKKELGVNSEIALSYFLIFTMELLGYHI